MSLAAELPRLRRRRALERALGAIIAEALDAPDIVEALINADGSIWLDRLGQGLSPLPSSLSISERETAIRLLAAEAGEVVGPSNPMLSAVLPHCAARVQALLPPLVAAPVIAIRKRALRLHGLNDYVADGAATAAQAQCLRDAVAEARTIVVAGGTGSGKTTLLNALLAEPAFLEARVLILEDTTELQCSSPNAVQLLTKRADPLVTMGDLVRMCLRLRPDRIVIGEVRDGAALDVVKAWNTGHPGGLLTVHANSAKDALLRLQDLCAEAAPISPRTIASAIDLVVFMARADTKAGRRIEAILDVKSYEGGSYGLN